VAYTGSDGNERVNIKKLETRKETLYEDSNLLCYIACYVDL
jgi:hypothetical protein